jgi:predicted transposase/invertase (TIGR01784 family)
MASRFLLDPKLDVVFKLLFGRGENKALLMSVLTAVLNPPAAFSSIELLDPELPKESAADKGVILDIRGVLADRRQVDIEMQSQRRPALRERALYICSRMYSGQLARGERYEHLRGAVVIFIFPFIESPGERLHSTFRHSDVHDHRQFAAHSPEIHYVELPKLASDPNLANEPLLHAWAKFFSASTDQEIEELSMTDPIFQEAKSALEKVSEDAKMRLLAERRETELFFRECDMRLARAEAQELGKAEGKAEGTAKGRAEGRAEGKAELLLTLLASKFGDVSDDVRTRVQKASEADVTAWSARMLSASSLAEVFAE